MFFYSTIFLELALTHSQLKDYGEETIDMLVYLHNSRKVIHRKCKSLYIFQQLTSPILWDRYAKDAHGPYRSMLEC